MADDLEPNLYPEPEDVLRNTLAYLKARLKAERAELKRYEALRDNRDDALEILISSAEDDAGKTESLVNDYRAAIRKLARVRP